MHKRLFHLYQRKRIINVNVNIIVAGLIAVALSKYPVHWMSLAIGPGLQWLKALLAGAIDGAVDIALYFVLHWIANHWKPLKPNNEKERRHHETHPGSFWKNASLVQAERYLLSPVFYVIAVGGMWALASFATIRESWAFVIAFSAAIIVTRAMHTAWGLWTGRFEWRTKMSSAEAESPESGLAVDDLAIAENAIEHDGVGAATDRSSSVDRNDPANDVDRFEHMRHGASSTPRR